MDISDPTKVFSEAKKYAESLNSLDILINIVNDEVKQSKFVDYDMLSIQYIINVNCTSRIALTKAFIPLLRRSKGRIVFISSVTGLAGFGLQSISSCTQFAISGFAKSIRPELKDLGI